MKLLPEPVCRECKNKHLAPPKINDPVYLLTKPALWSGGIEQILAEHKIPCLKKGVQGSAPSVVLGYFGESYHFFVPYGALEKSKGLLAGFFEDETGGLEDDPEDENIPLEE